MWSRYTGIALVGQNKWESCLLSTGLYNNHKKRLAGIQGCGVFCQATIPSYSKTKIIKKKKKNTHQKLWFLSGLKMELFKLEDWPDGIKRLRNIKSLNGYYFKGLLTQF